MSDGLGGESKCGGKHMKQVAYGCCVAPDAQRCKANALKADDVGFRLQEQVESNASTRRSK
jgi:hypothetical protein